MKKKTDKRNKRRGGFYWIKNEPYISVTNVLQVIDKPALRWWFGKEVYLAMAKEPSLSQQEALSAPYKTSGKAKSRGTTIHSVVEAYKTSGVIIDSVPVKFRGYAEAFYSWVNDTQIEVLENEKTVISKKHKYAGTLDLIVKKNGEIWLVDVKTSKQGKIYIESELQVSAYMEALKEMGQNVDKGFILALGETGKYTYKEVKNRFDVFIAVKYLWEFLNQEKCRKLGYSVNSVEKSLKVLLQKIGNSAKENVTTNTG